MLEKNSSIIDINHTVNPFCCMVSGISDQYAWKTGNQLPQYYLFWASGMCSFAYIKYKKAKPPRMIFFGTNTENQYNNICKIMNCTFEKYENHKFQSTLIKMTDNINNGYPVILGPLDMFYLPYLKAYRNEHIPIHYVMAFGYNESDNQIIVYDCDKEHKQHIGTELLEKALNVSVPGIGKKNTIHIFHWPKEIPSIKEIAYKSLLLRIDFMLKPPNNNFGISGMKKLALELINWPKELTEDEIKESLNTMVNYMDDRFNGEMYDGGRTRFANEYLKITANILKKRKLSELVDEYYESGNMLNLMAWDIINNQHSLSRISSILNKVAEKEEKAYLKLQEIVM